MNPCNSTTVCLERQVQVCTKRMASTSRAPKTERNHQAKRIGCSASAVSVLQPLTLRIGVQANQLSDKGRKRCTTHKQKMKMKSIIDEANDQEARRKRSTALKRGPIQNPSWVVVQGQSTAACEAKRWRRIDKGITPN